MMNAEAVETVATARRMSLTKREMIKSLFHDLFNGIYQSCGFCDLASYLAKPRLRGCNQCVVSDRCHKIQREASKIEDMLTELIDSTIDFLQEMEVTEK